MVFRFFMASLGLVSIIVGSLVGDMFVVGMGTATAIYFVPAAVVQLVTGEIL
jgi:hypothetical protein